MSVILPPSPLAPLFPHQRAALRFSDGRAASFLAHSPGTGKTRTSYLIRDANVDVETTLIICPSTALGVWVEQAARWSHLDGPLIMVASSDFTLPRGFTGTVLVSYAMLSLHKGLRTYLRSLSWGLLIVDEAHKLKNRESARTHAVYGPDCKNDGIAGSADKVLLLSGTPILATPDELWPHLRAFRPDMIDKCLSYEQFIDRYCVVEERWVNGSYLPRVTSANKHTIAELKAKLPDFLHFADWRKVAKDMPELTWQDWGFDISELAPDVRAKLGIEQVPFMQEIVGMNDDEILSYARTNPYLATYRRMTGMLKSNLVAQTVMEDFEAGLSKVILFAHHRDVINHLATSLRHLGVVTLTGDTPMKERLKIVEAFQRGEPGVFIGQTQAAGEAIALTAAHIVYLVEPDYTPAISYQAVKRAHRQGQVNPVIARVCSLLNSFDQIVARICVRKCETIKLTTGEEVS
jgi:SWI/SNF-related matrix-associated actin-dependent regulator 1 of chromatin subfamily A